ncbi:MAG: MqnA/MqnD/SBP family protein [Planctomycetota bacterium]
MTTPTAQTDTIELTIGHSPDPDDAFMWWPLGSVDPDSPSDPTIDTGRFRFFPVAADIQELNRRAHEDGDLDITAVSFHAAATSTDRYAVTSCGASIGDGYGPKLVARAGRETLPKDAMIALPGEHTTAYLLSRLMLGDGFRPVFMPFETVTGAIQRGEVDAGVVIHEAQITYADEGLGLVRDLGGWWHEATGLPTPLGANAVRLDLDERYGAGTLGEVTTVLHRSILHALERRDFGVDYALGFAQPGTSREQADAFIAMYVNELTVDMCERGEEALRLLVGMARERGLLASGPDIRIVRPA